MDRDRKTKLLTKLLKIADACFRLRVVSATLPSLRASAPPYSPITRLMAGLFDASGSVGGCAMKAGAVIGTSASDRAYAAQRSCQICDNPTDSVTGWGVFTSLMIFEIVTLRKFGLH